MSSVRDGSGTVDDGCSGTVEGYISINLGTHTLLRL